MNQDKTFRTEHYRTFLIGRLPEPLERKGPHLQIFDNYIHETRLRLRSIRIPETKEWTRLLQKRYSARALGSEWRIEEIELSEAEYEHFKPFEGNEIRKNRYSAEFDGRQFEFDVYLGPLWGLALAKVNFKGTEVLESYAPPPFLIAEVTDVPFFDGTNLVNRSFEDVQVEIEKLFGSASGKGESAN